MSSEIESRLNFLGKNEGIFSLFLVQPGICKVLILLCILVALF